MVSGATIVGAHCSGAFPSTGKEITMGVDTRLYINNRWNLGDIKNVLEHHLKVEKVSIRTALENTPCYYVTFMLNENSNLHPHATEHQDITMWVDMRVNTPLGISTMLSFRYHTLSVEILRKIGRVLGGFLQEQDTEEQYEMFDGLFHNEDGLPYFLEYSILHNECNGWSVKQLNESIHLWHNQVKSNRNRMELFPSTGKDKCIET